MSHNRMHPYHHNKHHQTPKNTANEETSPMNGDSPKETGEEEIETVQPELESDEAKQDISSEAAKYAEEAKKEVEDMRLRMAAEMDNFKKRLSREHQEQMRYASEKVLSDLLPALDNLDLALQYASKHEACKDMMQGIEMTRKQLQDAIAKHGLVSVGEPGEEFNPEIHEAIGMESNPDMEKNTVSKIMQRGYKLNDKLIRPAKVMVNN